MQIKNSVFARFVGEYDIALKRQLFYRLKKIDPLSATLCKQY